MWYLVPTTTGAHNLSITITGATDAIKLNASSFNGVSQSSPLDAVNTAGGTTGNPSASVTTVTAGDVVVATLHRHSTTAATTNRTPLHNDAITSVLGAASYQLATTPGSYSDTYTGSADHNWAMVIAAFKPASGSSSVTYPHVDHLGSTEIVTDDDGDVVHTLDYLPYGTICVDESTGGANERKKFTGYEYDSTPDLNYAKARYYGQDEGRFLS